MWPLIKVTAPGKGMWAAIWTQNWGLELKHFNNLKALFCKRIQFRCRFSWLIEPALAASKPPTGEPSFWMKSVIFRFQPRWSSWGCWRKKKSNGSVIIAIFLSCHQLLNSINRFASSPSISGLFCIQFRIRHPSVSPLGVEQLMYGIIGSPAIDL